MIKILTAASREFKSTVLTKAFFFGVILFPLIILGGITAITSLGLLSSEKSAIVGEIAVADSTDSGIVARALEAAFDPEVIQAQQEAKAAAMQAEMERVAPQFASRPEMQIAMGIAFGRPMEITIVELPADFDPDAQKERIRSGELLAFVVASQSTMRVPDPDATPESQPQPDQHNNARDLPENTYHLSHDPGLDESVTDNIERVVRRAVTHQRFIDRGYDPEEIQRLNTWPSAQKISITETGETESVDGLNMIIPVVFMMLIWISVMSGGQYLLMSTIEEKSSRVMEVLLSAISPMQLLTGKILGQGVVGLLILLIYAGVGIFAANQMNVMSLIPLNIIPWLILYFLMAYFFFAALMAAVGSAVTEISEAQSLMGPIMTLLMFPLILWFWIADSPNSLFSQIMSFVPPATPFVMVLRLSQTTDPVPLWQIITAPMVGAAGVVFTVWAATKIFRIGVLMYGTPPTFAGLIKWLRYA